MMIKIPVYNTKGEKTGEMNLSEKVFGLPANDSLLHQVYVSQSANKRTVIAHTKDRGERAGSGKKPWRQKGTGNARVGSARTPVWRKGGVVFGPRKERNFKKKINKKMARKAVRVALSEKVRSNNFLVLDEIKLKEKKTKEFLRILGNLKMKGSALVGFSDQEKGYSLASRNIKNVHNISVNNLNVSDLLNRKSLLLSKDSVKFLENKYK